MRRIALFGICFLLLTACHGVTQKPHKTKVKIVQVKKVLQNIPVFPGAQVDLDNTFIYEAGNIRAAVITFKASGKIKDAVEFYKRKMVEEGWNLVSSFLYQQKASMFFDSPDSTCSIEIEQNYGALTITVRTGTKSPMGDVK